MKTKLLALALLAGGTMFAGPRIGIGIGVGVGPGYGYYNPAPVYAALAYVAPAYVAPAPVYPAPAIGFDAGYWYTVGGHRYWHEGYRRDYGFRGKRFGRGFRR